LTALGRFMPMYQLKCSGCQFSGEVFAKVTELDSKGRVLCPECGERAEQDWSKKTVSAGGAALSFHGGRQHSMTEAFHPSEVQEAREMFGERSGACIQNDGTVQFANRADQKAYMKRKAEIYARAHAQ
jgi:putative FmdB family regulatory protein